LSKSTTESLVAIKERVVEMLVSTVKTIGESQEKTVPDESLPLTDPMSVSLSLSRIASLRLIIIPDSWRSPQSERTKSSPLAGVAAVNAASSV
jgi:hypothetical protein